MSVEKRHFSTITQYFDFLGKPSPEHPLIACIDVKIDTLGVSKDCPELHEEFTTGFYIISLKNIIAGEVLYGKKNYDASSGTMLFMAPNQILSSRGIRLKSEGRNLLIHPDFFVGHPFEDTINNSTFFDYDINEALHLSTKEEKMVRNLFDGIKEECLSTYDESSRDIMLSQVKTLLTYSQRFYKRQFAQRQDLSESIHSNFKGLLDNHFENSPNQALPEVREIASKLGFSSRYLSDAIKSETGKSAKETIQLFLIDKAKSLLAGTDDSITTIAYELGFSTPQYFVRLFKKKTGMTPTEYRHSIH